MQCGECTMCCDLFAVQWLNKPANTPCEHCELKKGCKIQETKPAECRDFECAYYQIDNLSESLRPDKCNMIFERHDEVFLGVQHPDHPVTEIARKQIEAFVKQGFSVVLVSPNRQPMFIINEKHDSQEIIDKIKLKVDMQYGNL